MQAICYLNISLDSFKKLKTAAPFYSKLTISFLFFQGWLKISFRISLIPENSVYLSRLKGLTSFFFCCCCLKGWEKSICNGWQFFPPKEENCFKLFWLISSLWNQENTFAKPRMLCQGIFCSHSSAHNPKHIRLLACTFQWLVYDGLFCVCVRAWQHPPFPHQSGIKEDL